MKTKLLGVVVASALFGVVPPAHSDGFLYSDGSYSTFAIPGAMFQSTQAFGINNAGQIVGSYQNDSFIPFGSHGFLYSGGVFTTLDNPLGTETQVTGINNAGQIVGTYRTGNSRQSFVYSGGVYTTLNVPVNYSAFRISDNGQIIGSYSSNGSHGFLYNVSSGSYTTIDFPGATGTHPNGINNAGQIVGEYNDSNGRDLGYFYDMGVYTTLDAPLAVRGQTVPLDINNRGQIVGYYIDASGDHSFLYSGGVTPRSTRWASTTKLGESTNEARSSGSRPQTSMSPVPSPVRACPA